MSDINFLYSDFLTFTSVPCSGAGAALHKPCLWDATGQHHPEEKPCSQKVPLSLLLVTGPQGCCDVTCLPASHLCKAAGGCLQVQRGQHWAHWAEQSHHCQTPHQVCTRSFLQELHAGGSRAGSTPWARQGCEAVSPGRCCQRRDIGHPRLLAPIICNAANKSHHSFWSVYEILCVFNRERPPCLPQSPTGGQ